MSKFEEKFKSVVNADKSEIGAKKSWNIVNSAFVAKLALLNSELTELQFVKAEAEEKLESAKINSGENILNRDSYLINLVNCKNKLTDIENQITELEETIKFLTETYEELK